jgi:hypothetical protein
MRKVPLSFIESIKKKNQVGSEVTVHLPQARMPPPAPASLINAKPSATRSSEAQQ